MSRYIEKQKNKKQHRFEKIYICEESQKQRGVTAKNKVKINKNIEGQKRKKLLSFFFHSCCLYIQST